MACPIKDAQSRAAAAEVMIADGDLDGARLPDAVKTGQFRSISTALRAAVLACRQGDDPSGFGQIFRAVAGRQGLSLNEHGRKSFEVKEEDRLRRRAGEFGRGGKPRLRSIFQNLTGGRLGLRNHGRDLIDSHARRRAVP